MRVKPIKFGSKYRMMIPDWGMDPPSHQAPTHENLQIAVKLPKTHAIHSIPNFGQDSEEKRLDGAKSQCWGEPRYVFEQM